MLRKLILLFCLTVHMGGEAQVLYRISGKNLEHDSFLMGTNMLTPYSFVDYIPGFNNAFESCKQLYTEVISNDRNKKEIQTKLLRLIYMPKDSTLYDLYTMKEAQYIDSQLKRYLGEDASIERQSMFKPATVSLHLGIFISMSQRRGIDFSIVMDRQLEVEAMRKNMTILAFETVDDQLNLIYRTPMDKQAKHLLQSFKGEDLVLSTKKTTQFYQDQNIKALFNLIDKETKVKCDSPQEYEQTMDEMLYSRNRDWVEQLEVAMPKAPTFIAVEAVHLLGKEGLIPLLQMKGYTVIPVKK